MSDMLTTSSTCVTGATRGPQPGAPTGAQWAPGGLEGTAFGKATTWQGLRTTVTVRYRTIS